MKPTEVEVKAGEQKPEENTSTDEKNSEQASTPENLQQAEHSAFEQALEKLLGEITGLQERITLLESENVALKSQTEKMSKVIDVIAEQPTAEPIQKVEGTFSSKLQAMGKERKGKEDNRVAILDKYFSNKTNK